MKVQPNSEVSSPVSKSTKRLAAPLLIILVIIVSAATGGAFGFWRGAEYGKKQATNQALKAVANLANPLNFLANNPVFPDTVIGKVTQASGTGISVRLVNGETKKILFASSTQVTKDNKVLTTNDIKKDSNVTVFIKSNDKDKKTPTATRIILR